MKKIVILILATAALNSCKKGTDDHSGKNKLVNKWELRELTGGIVATVTYQPGNGNLVEFKSDHTFAYYYKDKVIESGTYDVQTTSEKNQYTINFHMQGYEKSQNAILKQGTLVLLRTSDCCDMPDHTYARIN
jgi:hypothetical protein